jgi:hypothetical protein
MPKKKGDRKRLTPVDKEWVFQTYLLLQNKSKTARRCGVSISSVNNIVRELTAREEEQAGLPATRESRATAAAQLAGKFHVRANELLESITPEMLEHGKIPIYDNKGKLIKYQEYGPSLLQLATSIGIITDKANVAQQFEQKMTQDANDGRLTMPQDFAGLLSACESTLRSIKVFDIRFEDDNQDVITNAKEIMAEVQAVEDSRPDVIDMNEFDNPA